MKRYTVSGFKTEDPNGDMVGYDDVKQEIEALQSYVRASDERAKRNDDTLQAQSREIEELKHKLKNKSRKMEKLKGTISDLNDSMIVYTLMLAQWKDRAYMMYEARDSAWWKMFSTINKDAKCWFND